jgi:hypothetical protein
MDMTLGPIDISPSKAEAFSDRWKYATSEKQDAQSFWREFFIEVCEIPDIRAANIEFEKPVISSLKGTMNFIDVFWRHIVLIEHKSAGKNLDEAEDQARGYITSLPPRLRPPLIIVSDFAHLRFVEIKNKSVLEFEISDLSKHSKAISILFNNAHGRSIGAEVEADEKAATLMANLYQEFESGGYKGHEVSVFLVRLLFLLFGEDTKMFKPKLFSRFLSLTSDSPDDLGPHLQNLFEALDVPLKKRGEYANEAIQDFPYVNGGLFSEVLPVFKFNAAMKKALIATTNYDWSSISPAIFGSMFQLIKSKEDRRALGEHYTTEANIHKVIDPLFMNELHAELEKSWDSKNKLEALKDKLKKFQFLDPACGCGNFLVVSYKTLRQLELDIIIRILQLVGKSEDLAIDGTWGLSVSLSQFSGIEYEEWSSQIATVAMFLADHQENLTLEKITGQTTSRFPLSESATIVHANALETDWNSLVKFDENTFVFGNPPFIGMAWLSPQQQEDNRKAFLGISAASTRTGRLDYVACWYAKSLAYMKGTKSRAAFVSTNSICQGDQARALAPIFVDQGFEIDFAHTTFKWTSDTSNAAAVHVIIMGFSSVGTVKEKVLYDYADLLGEPVRLTPKHINFYLVGSPDIFIEKRNKPLLFELPDCTKGSQPTDGGHLFISEDLLPQFKKDPIASNYIRKFIGATELLYNEDRWCLWLVDASPSDLKNSSLIQERLKLVAQTRRESPTPSVKAQAQTPALFTQIRQPAVRYLAMPEVSSSNREYLPVAYFEPNVIAGNKVIFIPNAPPWIFAYLSSTLFMLWVKTFAGRLKSDISISPGLTYFCFPFIKPSGASLQEIESLAEEITQIRKAHSTASLADLYDALSMPSDLRSAHKRLDQSIEKLYGLKRGALEIDRIEALLVEYNKISESGQIQI